MTSISTIEDNSQPPRSRYVSRATVSLSLGCEAKPFSYSTAPDFSLDVSASGDYECKDKECSTDSEAGCTVPGYGCEMDDGSSGICTMQDDSSCTCDSQCGNDFVDAGEECDGANFGGATCADYVSEGYFGSLACSNECTIDTTNCQPPCGSGSNCYTPGGGCELNTGDDGACNQGSDGVCTCESSCWCPDTSACPDGTQSSCPSCSNGCSYTYYPACNCDGYGSGLSASSAFSNVGNAIKSAFSNVGDAITGTTCNLFGWFC